MNGPPACNFWVRFGDCRFGTACRFAHPNDPSANSSMGPARGRLAGQPGSRGRGGAGQELRATGPPPRIPLMPMMPAYKTRNWWTAGAMAQAGPRFRVMSYNVLADELAQNHRWELHRNTPPEHLSWPRRWTLIKEELEHYTPDLVCLQEIDHWDEVHRDMAMLGFQGTYAQRSGGRGDGCATFWRTNVFQSVAVSQLQFSDFDLRDNVGTLTLLCHKSPHALDDQLQQMRREREQHRLEQQLRRQRERCMRDREQQWQQLKKQQRKGHEAAAATSSSSSSDDSDDEVPRFARRVAEPSDAVAAVPSGQYIAVANTHVLFNPKRGDVKLGQLRLLIKHLQALVSATLPPEQVQHVAALVMGDMNHQPDTPLYNFMKHGWVDCLLHHRKAMAGTQDELCQNAIRRRSSNKGSRQQQPGSGPGFFQPGAPQPRFGMHGGPDDFAMQPQRAEPFWDGPPDRWGGPPPPPQQQQPLHPMHREHMFDNGPLGPYRPPPPPPFGMVPPGMPLPRLLPPHPQYLQPPRLDMGGPPMPPHQPFDIGMQQQPGPPTRGQRLQWEEDMEVVQQAQEPEPTGKVLTLRMLKHSSWSAEELITATGGAHGTHLKHYLEMEEQQLQDHKHRRTQAKQQVQCKAAGAGRVNQQHHYNAARDLGIAPDVDMENEGGSQQHYSRAAVEVQDCDMEIDSEQDRPRQLQQGQKGAARDVSPETGSLKQQHKKAVQAQMKQHARAREALLLRGGGRDALFDLQEQQKAEAAALKKKHQQQLLQRQFDKAAQQLQQQQQKQGISTEHNRHKKLKTAGDAVAPPPPPPQSEQQEQEVPPPPPPPPAAAQEQPAVVQQSSGSPVVTLAALKSWGKHRMDEPLPDALGDGVARHGLLLRSCYAELTGSEPEYTSCHDSFFGTVDYIWYTPQAGRQQLQPVAVLLPPDADEHLMCMPRPGMPNATVPSDHISLIADFELRQVPN